jgi:hypothetical protein
MDLQPQPPSSFSPDAREEARERAYEQLNSILKRLKDERKILARDWERLTPRERSAQSRIVKELEQQKHALEEEIEMNR